jgi:hypothetical protein
MERMDSFEFSNQEAFVQFTNDENALAEKTIEEAKGTENEMYVAAVNELWALATLHADKEFNSGEGDLDLTSSNSNE